MRGPLVGVVCGVALCVPVAFFIFSSAAVEPQPPLSLSFIKSPFPHYPNPKPNPIKALEINRMGLAANISTAVVLVLLLLSLLVAAPSASAKLNFTTITYHNYSDTSRLQFDSNSTVGGSGLQGLQVTISPGTNLSGRVLYKFPFELWRGKNDTYSDRVASFNTSFLVFLNQLDNYPTPGEGLAFVVAPDLNIPLQSFGEYLGLTNSTTDGDKSNQIIAVELDTFKEDFDPDSNHVGLNINSVRSSKTTSLTPLGFQLVGPNGTANFFTVWVQYDGVKKVIAVYVAQQAYTTDPTPPRPDNPILTSYLELRGAVNQYSYFGFSASTGINSSQLNCVLRWNLTVVYYYKKSWLKIGLEVGIPTVVLLPALVGLAYYFRKRMSIRRLDEQMLGKVKNMPGMPKEYEYKDLQKATNNFDETMKLGQGGFGVVYKGILEKENLEVAVKMFSRDNLKGQDDFFQELTMINQLRHKYLVPLQGWCHKHGKLLLVYDYMPNLSLDKHLFSSDANSTPLSWNLRCNILFGVASALHYLHYEYQKKVLHRDLKASNIILDAEFNAKLGDFGLARALDNEKTSYMEAEGVPGTRGYIAPECLQTGKATEQSDVYAFGAVLLEVVCGRRPGSQVGGYPFLVDWVWSLHREGQLLEAVDHRLRVDNVADEARRLLLLGLACSHPTACERPRTQEIVQMISDSLPVAHVPPFKPPFVWASVPIWEEDISLATTANTTSFTTSHYVSGVTPLATNPEIQCS